MGIRKRPIKCRCDCLKKMAVRLSPAAYICIVAAIIGSFICGADNLLIWYMLMFHSYTDIRTMELYVFPVRVCIVFEILFFIFKYGFAYENYSGLFICLTVIFLLKVFKLYAKGDMEIFFMLVMSAARKGKEIVGYSLILLYAAMAVFCIMFGCYAVIHSIRKKREGKPLKKVKMAPMVPSISIAYALCCVIG